MVTVGDGIAAERAGWSFGGDTFKNFDEHVKRSVPFYEEGHQLICRLSDFFVTNGSIVYDLGCSTGTLSKKLVERHHHKASRVIAIEIEKNMADASDEKLREYSNAEVMNCDILDVEFEPADLIIAYYAMQFVHPKNRQLIFDRIYKALNWGGAFLLFEKVRGPDARFQDIAMSLYTDFKLEQGYTPDEIIGKSRSLKGILEPFSTQGNIDLLKRAGFVDVMSVMKYVCFEGMLAIK